MTCFYITLPPLAKSGYQSTNPHSRKLLLAHNRADRSHSLIARREMTTNPHDTLVEQPEHHEQMEYSYETLPHAVGSYPDEIVGQ
jgi:hypothetical protein